MTHAWNLLRFGAVAAAVVFAFAFNLAAMYAQVVYVFLPGSRVTGAPPMHWDATAARTPHQPWEFVVLGIAGLVVLWAAFHPKAGR